MITDRRKIWLENPKNNSSWDLLPDDAYDKNNACPFLGIKGMGYSQEVTQTQVNTEYFVSKVLSKNTPISGTLYFQDTEHIKAFQNFVSDFRNQLLLFYAPSGVADPSPVSDEPYYKKVIITMVDKTEMDETGWYLIPMTLTTQDDVWTSRDKVYSVPISGQTTVGTPLVYPYTYPYQIGGRNALVIPITNNGRETGCEIKIKNLTGVNLSTIEWFIDRTYTDYYGVLHENADTQKSKWNLILSNGSELIVNSNPLTQEAKIKYRDGSFQSVVDLQEPSWDYINFVQVPQGQSRIVFYIDGSPVDISFTYREQKELV